MKAFLTFILPSMLMFFFMVLSEDVTNARQTAYIFSHGLCSDQEQAHLFCENKDQWIITDPFISFNYPDAISNTKYDALKVNLGQDLDIQTLRDIVDKACKDFPDHEFIASGISRGAATIINYVALDQPAKISALILESPFDSLQNVIRHLLKRYRMNWFPFSNKIGNKILRSTFPLVNLKGIFPINHIHKIPFHIPVIIIHSRKDLVVPISSSYNLYKALMEAGHKNVYLLELASGAHGKLMQGPEKELYLNVIHAFYKHNNLPHNPICAQKGYSMLSYCQPSLEEISRRMLRTRSVDFLLSQNEELFPSLDEMNMLKEIFEKSFSEEEQSIEKN